jgi:hypothetical protein
MANALEPRRSSRWPTALTLALALAGALPATARGVTPESPEVKRVVDRALAWLQKQNDERLGGKCLIGLSFYKANPGLNHPKVAAALEACRSGVNNPSDDNYSLGLALIFLCETDAKGNRQLIERYVATLLKRQKANGSWGYEGGDIGDTSQIQYPTLGLWLAFNSGIDVPMGVIERDCAWLVRTQDPSGAWGYQGKDPGNFQRVAQDEVRHSLAAAGLGSLYICADLLGITGVKGTDQSNEVSELPPALRPLAEPDPKVRRRNYVTKAIDHQLVRRAMADGNKWLQQNYTVESTNWNHYYLYALERYHSFRELAEGQAEAEPRWYNDVFAMLARTQMPEGYWSGQDYDTIATCFSVMVLLRSARKTIKKYGGDLGQGVLLGGLGLPPNTADLRERDGRIVETAFTGSIDELIATIENSDDPELAASADSVQPPTLDSDVTKRSGQIARLRALVSAGEYPSRLVAVRALGRARDLDNVPILIYALTDPDVRIVREADKGLRFISRKFQGVGLPPDPKPDEIKTAIAGWKAWYQSIRPNAAFLE